MSGRLVQQGRRDQRAKAECGKCTGVTFTGKILTSLAQTWESRVAVALVNT